MGDSITIFRWPVAAFDGLRLVLARYWSALAWGLLVVGGCYAVTGVSYLLGLEWDSWLLVGANERFVAIGLVPVLAVIAAVICCAAYRAILTPEASTFAYLRFGVAERRMAGFYLALAAGMAALFIGANLIGPWGFVLLLAGFVALVRVSLIGPALYHDARLNLTGGWRLGGVWFWNLLGMYLILAVVASIGFGVASWIWNMFLIANAEALEQMATEPQLVQYFQLFWLSALLIILYTAIFVVLVAPGIVVYREVAGEPDTDAEPIAETFS